jgi:hypothetical protein
MPREEMKRCNIHLVAAHTIIFCGENLQNQEKITQTNPLKPKKYLIFYVQKIGHRIFEKNCEV